MTVTKALRTCVPFNCVGRLDSCLRDLVVGYQVKCANHRESHEDCSTEARREAKRVETALLEGGGICGLAATFWSNPRHPKAG